MGPWAASFLLWLGATHGPDIADFGPWRQALEVVAEQASDPRLRREADRLSRSSRASADALRLLLSEHGPYAYYLDPQQAAFVSAREAERGHAGVGLRRVMGDEASPIELAWVDPKGPAARAGLRAGDRLLSVEGEAVEPGAAVVLVAAHFYGTPNASRQVEVLRGKAIIRTSVTLEKTGDLVPELSWRLRGDQKFALVRVLRFEPGVARRVTELVNRARWGGAQALILDLRGNPGGSVEEAASVADVFISAGPIYERVDANGRRHSSAEASAGGAGEDLKLAVLVDGGSASAAELVAAALARHQRAWLVGGATYGKTSVQRRIGLPGGGLISVPIGHYRPGGGPEVPPSGLEPGAVPAKSVGDLAQTAVDVLITGLKPPTPSRGA